VESSHSATAGAGTPQVAGHRIKPYEPMPFGAASMSPRRFGLRDSTFNHSEDTLEIAPTAHPSGRLPMPQATE